MENLLKNNLEKLRSENLDSSGRRELLSMFHKEDVEYDLKVELYKELDSSTELQLGKRTDGFERLWRRISSIQKDKVRTFKTAYIYWTAAILVLGFLFGNLIPFDLFHLNKTEYYTAKAPMGSVSEMILPDGTGISLNAGSEIKYVAGNNKRIREVFLTGEAWFDVEKSDKIPFIVHTPFYDVQVKGTKFNVKAYPDDNDVITTLEEGSVLVGSGKNLIIENGVILKPGEQLVYDKMNMILKVNEVDPEVFSSWRNNKLIFINMSLGELITLLERKYGVEIEVLDERILDYHYDGTIKNETIIEVLNILQSTLPVHYTIRKQKIKIERR